jgi:gliding motility-associated-like protein
MYKTLFFLLIAMPCLGQYLSNPSFEGPPSTGVPPPSWKPCLNLSTPDTQPGSWEITLPPSNGNSYISMVTRGLGGYSVDGTTEAIGTQLLSPLVSSKCYLVSVDVAIFPGARFVDVWESKIFYYDTPAILNVWSSSSNCEKKTLLYRSSPIANTRWEPLIFTITPKEEISFLLLEADYSTVEKKYGNVLLDNMKIEAMSIDLGPDMFVCNGDSKSLIVGGSYDKIEWSTGSTLSSIDIRQSGNYSVTVEKNGCILKDSVLLTFSTPLKRVLGNDTTLCPGDQLVLDATTLQGQYEWGGGSRDAKAIIHQPGQYSLTVSNGCETRNEEINIEFDQNYCCNLSVPNVFTPNGDNLNDFFETTTRSGVDNFLITVYNRWGTIVFQNNDVNTFWNGETDHKNLAASGIYYWTASISCVHGAALFKNEYRGTVTLLR